MCQRIVGCCVHVQCAIQLIYRGYTGVLLSRCDCVLIGSCCVLLKLGRSCYQLPVVFPVLRWYTEYAVLSRSPSHYILMLVCVSVLLSTEYTAYTYSYSSHQVMLWPMLSLAAAVSMCWNNSRTCTWFIYVMFFLQIIWNPHPGIKPAAFSGTQSTCRTTLLVVSWQQCGAV